MRSATPPTAAGRHKVKGVFTVRAPARGGTIGAVTTDTPSTRVYFVDGPAAGRSLLADRSAPRLDWQHGTGPAHWYRRVTNLRGTHFYRSDR